MRRESYTKQHCHSLIVLHFYLSSCRYFSKLLLTNSRTVVQARNERFSFSSIYYLQSKKNCMNINFPDRLFTSIFLIHCAVFLISFLYTFLISSSIAYPASTYSPYGDDIHSFMQINSHFILFFYYVIKLISNFYDLEFFHSLLEPQINFYVISNGRKL